jgi:hypothetical protein
MSFPGVSILLAALSGAAAKVPLTHETMWLMKRVGAPLPSPDAQRVTSLSTGGASPR